MSQSVASWRHHVNANPTICKFANSRNCHATFRCVASPSYTPGSLHFTTLPRGPHDGPCPRTKRSPCCCYCHQGLSPQRSSADQPMSSILNVGKASAGTSCRHKALPAHGTAAKQHAAARSEHIGRQLDAKKCRLRKHLKRSLAASLP